MAPKNTDPRRVAESNLGYILGVTATFHAIALIFVWLRLYARVFIVKAFGKDDAFIVVSTVSSAPFLTDYDHDWPRPTLFLMFLRTFIRSYSEHAS